MEVNKIMFRFRELRYIRYLREKFRKWYFKSQEKKIEEKFHYKHLTKFLKTNNIDPYDNNALDDFLTNW